MPARMRGSLLKLATLGRGRRATRSGGVASAALAPEPGEGSAPASLPSELHTTLTGGEREILERCRPYTMTSPQRLLSITDSVRHIAHRGIAGAFVECGVWRGGSVLAMILTLQQLGLEDRDVHLYDTFEGMTQPTEHDTSPFHRPAMEEWQAAQSTQTQPYSELFAPELFSRQTVEATLLETGYPAARIHLHQGDVLETIPAGAPDSIALLRLDTDWYESTRHELEHLYPRLPRGGILIIDDYGHWEGARRAVDEYFAGGSPLLHRIDYTGRIAVKD